MFYFLAGGHCKGIYSYNKLLRLQFLVCGFLYLVFYLAIRRLLLKDRDGEKKLNRNVCYHTGRKVE